MSNGSSSILDGKELVPKSHDPEQLRPRHERNYVKENLNKAIYEQPPSVHASANKQGQLDGIYKHRSQGKVPKYLNKYN